VERGATAGASLIRDIDNLLDPLEMGRQRSPVGLAQTRGGSPARLVASMLRLG